MKVLQVINNLDTGGAEKLLLDSIPKYIEKGVSVDLLVLQDKDFPFLKSLEKRAPSSKIIKLSSGSVYHPFLIFKLIKYIKNYNVIHLHLFPTLYWVVIASVISFSKNKLIYTEHSTNNRRRNSFLFQVLDKLIYRRISKIITIAEEVDVNLKKHLGFKESKFALIHNGIDLQKIEAAMPYSKNEFFSENDKILMQVASLRVQKDHETLIRAIAKLPSDYKLILVGDGPLKTKMEALINSLNCNEKVLFLGIRTDVPRLLKTADAIILSSHHEGLSLSSIEGMAAARPFIASKVPGLTAIVENYGILFEHKNDEDLKNKVLEVFNNEVYYNEIAKKCSQRAQEFNIDTMVEKYIQVYKNCLQ